MPSSNLTTITAAQHVLSIPELLGEILKYYATSAIHHNRPCPCRRLMDFPSLLNLALVNRLWFHECMRLIWEQPLALNARPFSHIVPSRRQIYANFIRMFCLHVGPKHRGWITRQKRIFKNLVLHHAILGFIQVKSNIENLYVPPVRAPVLNSLCVYVCGWGRREESALGRVRSYHLAKRIKTLFPSIRKLSFTCDSNLGPGCFGIFVGEFPGAEVTTDMNMGHFWDS